MDCVSTRAPPKWSENVKLHNKPNIHADPPTIDKSSKFPLKMPYRNDLDTILTTSPWHDYLFNPYIRGLIWDGGRGGVAFTQASFYFGFGTCKYK